MYNNKIPIITPTMNIFNCTWIKKIKKLNLKNHTSKPIRCDKTWFKGDLVTRFLTLFYQKTLPGPLWTGKDIGENVCPHGHWSRITRWHAVSVHRQQYVDTFGNFDGFSQILKEPSGEKIYLNVFTNLIALIKKYEIIRL